MDNQLQRPSVIWDSNWDRREPESPTDPTKVSRTETDSKDQNNKILTTKPTATRHLILIRHGQCRLGENDELWTLTPLGREQAELSGQRLKELAHPYTMLVNSTMPRAKQTADIIACHLPDVPRAECPLLREGKPILPEPSVGHWKSDEFSEDGARIEEAYRKYFHRADPEQTQDSFEIIVCHANVIRYFVCRLLQFPPQAWMRMSLYHGSLTWVSISPSGWVSLCYLGDAGFMPTEKITLSSDSRH